MAGPATGQIWENSVAHERGQDLVYGFFDCELLIEIDLWQESFKWINFSSFLLLSSSLYHQTFLNAYFLPYITKQDFSWVIFSCWQQFYEESAIISSILQIKKWGRDRSSNVQEEVGLRFTETSSQAQLDTVCIAFRYKSNYKYNTCLL